MLLLPGSVRILLASEPTDMRNGIDGLTAIAQGAWREDVYAGSYFVFLSRRRDGVKSSPGTTAASSSSTSASSAVASAGPPLSMGRRP